MSQLAKLMLDIAVDVSAIVVYWLTLYFSDMAWVFTGLNVAMRHLFDKADPVPLIISAMQISDTCDSTRVLLYGPTVYIVWMFVFSAGYLSRTPLFSERTHQEKRAFVCLMMTVALSTRGEVRYRALFNTVRAGIYMLLCRVSDRGADTWDVQARVCWCLSAYTYPLLCVAVLQVAFDAEAYVITVEKRKKGHGLPSKAAKMETWDISLSAV